MKIQLNNSDVISFHDYSDPAKFEARILSLKRYGRPILCTEYMARGNKSTFEGSLPVALKYRVAAYNWGMVQGKKNLMKLSLPFGPFLVIGALYYYLFGDLLWFQFMTPT